MWKTSYAATPSSSPKPELVSNASIEGESPIRTSDDLRAYAAEEVKIGKGQSVSGTISGTGPLYIDGRVVGDIDFPTERVTIGEHGVFVAQARKGRNFGITAREIVIMGQVVGNVYASHRVEILPNGSVTGDLEAPRLRISTGGLCKGIVKVCGDGAAALPEVEPILSLPVVPKLVRELSQVACIGAAS